MQTSAVIFGLAAHSWPRMQPAIAPAESPPTSSSLSSVYPSTHQSSYLFFLPIHVFFHHSFIHSPTFLSLYILSFYLHVCPFLCPSSIHLLPFYHRYFYIIYLLSVFLSPIYLNVSHLSIFVCLSVCLSNLCDESTRVCILIHRGVHSTLLLLIMSFIWERKKEIKECFVLLFSPVSDLESSAWR